MLAQLQIGAVIVLYRYHPIALPEMIESEKLFIKTETFLDSHVNRAYIKHLESFRKYKIKHSRLLDGGAKRRGSPKQAVKYQHAAEQTAYLCPSEGSDWASLMSICLTAMSLAPGIPAGFLQVNGIWSLFNTEAWRQKMNGVWACVTVF